MRNLVSSICTLPRLSCLVLTRARYRHARLRNVEEGAEATPQVSAGRRWGEHGICHRGGQGRMLPWVFFLLHRLGTLVKMWNRRWLGVNRFEWAPVITGIDCDKCAVIRVGVFNKQVYLSYRSAVQCLVSQHSVVCWTGALCWAQLRRGDKVGGRRRRGKVGLRQGEAWISPDVTIAITIAAIVTIPACVNKVCSAILVNLSTISTSTTVENASCLSSSSPASPLQIGYYLLPFTNHPRP